MNEPSSLGSAKRSLKLPSPVAAGMDEESIDGLAALLVGGEAFVDQLTLIPADLRCAVGVDVAAVNDGVGIVLERRGKIANRREAQARHRRILRFVGELVGLPGFEAALQRHPVRIELTGRSPFGRTASPRAGSARGADAKPSRTVSR